MILLGAAMYILAMAIPAMDHGKDWTGGTKPIQLGCP